VDGGPSLTACGPLCVDVQTSQLDCGKCGNACTGGQTCKAGACECPTGLTLCNGLCIDPNTDNLDCGKCGNVCKPPAKCQAVDGGTAMCK
jgi:hypothetical protein